MGHPASGALARVAAGVRVVRRFAAEQELPYAQAMDAREYEDQMLERCVEVARSESGRAQSAEEANVFLLAGSVLRSRMRREADRLTAASKAYFDRHPGSELEDGEAVRRGWIVSMPRLREMLSAKLGWNMHAPV